ncbi:MAG TPA: hypothetical protein VEK79_11485 [Thermoanaerobaculia bacterium]|nr:hypothetical protein [Thermoanaerobaculia bacterium]
MFLAEMVFATRLLGLVAGEQSLQIQVEDPVRRVEVHRDGQRIASLHQPPWIAQIDLGLELEPHELTVVAFDAEGREVGRDTQALNVARPAAELGVLLDRDAKGQMTASIRWGHFAHQAPTKVIVKLDGRVVSKGHVISAVPLGNVDASKIHVLAVEASFRDGITSRREIAFGGGFSEQMPAEMTPVAVRQRKNAPHVRAGCFATASGPLPEATVEDRAGSAFFILNGKPRLARNRDIGARRGEDLFALHKTDIEVVNPVPELIRRDDGVTRLFDFRTVPGARGTRRLVMSSRTPFGPARVTDAVGAAALRALRGGKRRVVVVVIGDMAAADRSVHTPPVMRRYLERVGVPLRVWSLTGPRPDLTATWGPVIDVSTPAALLAATSDLRTELNSQRVAWLPVSPLEAFRVRASDDCAFVPLAGDLTPSDRAASAR